jgi:hypothetical protein
MTHEEVKWLCGQIDWLRQTRDELAATKDTCLDAEEREWWQRCWNCCQQALLIKESELSNSLIMQPISSQIQ